ncbi:hypothetical protein BS47DRAFT_1365765 [Hydnum rufescens UP504]|uniref:Uncharacterized protein n=1 Tax=Hydnum rufescens UP504 TaxID=1448309 RepID=A0A9P6APT7_9AGAM|nr:hypothetical protein BS47DRAFT_1365765 [Hydnum rufescens UP504]
MPSIKIYLPSPSTQEWIMALSIPHSKAQWLSHCPLKWLRYVMFAICGAKGDLCTDKEGNLVDYNFSLDDPLAEHYYYLPNDIIKCDGNNCVITGWLDGKATHIFPLCKGEMVLLLVKDMEDSMSLSMPSISTWCKMGFLLVIVFTSSVAKLIWDSFMGLMHRAPPSPMLLNFMYSTAVYCHWGEGWVLRSW